MIWKRRKLSNLAQGRYSGSHAIAWVAVNMSVLKVFPTTSKSVCGSIAVPRFVVLLKGLWGLEDFENGYGKNNFSSRRT